VYIYNIPVAGITKKSELSIEQPLTFQSQFKTSLLPRLAAAKLGRMPVRTGTLDISLFGHSQLRSHLYPQGMVN
jgi:hypothetical protein